MLSLEENPLEKVPYDNILRLPQLQVCTLNKKYQEDFLRDKITDKIIFKWFISRFHYHII